MDVHHVHGSSQGVRVDLHMVTGSKSYKTTTSGITTQAMGRIENLVRVGRIKCYMTFMIVDTNGYNMLMGLDFLLKIGADVDVERDGLNQVCNGLGLDVQQVIKLNMINVIVVTPLNAIEARATKSS
jgi:hypothetical protein